MRPALTIGIFTFHLYGLIVGLAVVIGWWWAEKRARQRRMNMSQFAWLGLWGVVGGLVGARLYHVIDYWVYYQAHPAQIGALWNGGLAIWGAIMGSMGGVMLGGHGKWREVVAWLDVMALALPLSQAIGRLGNWVNGELYGRPTTWPWGIWVEGVRVQPLFLYEALLNLLLFWWLNWKLQAGRRGQVIGAYLIGYGGIRLVLEPMRMRVWEMNGVVVAQLLSVVAIIIGSVLWRYGTISKK